MQVFDECHKAKNLIAIKGERRLWYSTRNRYYVLEHHSWLIVITAHSGYASFVCPGNIQTLGPSLRSGPFWQHRLDLVLVPCQHIVTLSRTDQVFAIPRPKLSSYTSSLWNVIACQAHVCCRQGVECGSVLVRLVLDLSFVTRRAHTDRQGGASTAEGAAAREGAVQQCNGCLRATQPGVHGPAGHLRLPGHAGHDQAPRRVSATKASYNTPAQGFGDAGLRVRFYGRDLIVMIFQGKCNVVFRV